MIHEVVKSRNRYDVLAAMNEIDAFIPCFLLEEDGWHILCTDKKENVGAILEMMNQFDLMIPNGIIV